jgi:hypothetical protein
MQAFYKMHAPATQVARRFEFSLWPKAWAAALCPTFQSTGLTCNAIGGVMQLSYNDCTFPNSSVIWLGRQALVMSSGTATCGTFPYPGASKSLMRQYVNGAGTSPSSMILTSAFGTTAVIDHATPNLGNFDSAPISAIYNGGYGYQVDYDPSGARSNVTLRERVAVAGSYDHSLNGSLAITETAGAASRTANGTIMVYLNQVQVIGSANFTNVVHSDMCCQPVSGTITTSFSAGVTSPTPQGAPMVGHSESLTFTGCGTARHTDYAGNVSNVILSRCY